MYLVGDIGATNTRLGLARETGGAFEIERLEVYPSTQSPGLHPLVKRYLEEASAKIAAASFGLPGPVEDRRVRTTNLPWAVDARPIETDLGVPVTLLNDLEAAAWGVGGLQPSQQKVLQAGEPTAGHQAVIAPGTGLGEALIVRARGETIPIATEGSHGEFGPASEDDVDLWRFLRARYGGHVSYERIASGPGLVALYEFYAARVGAAESPPWSGDEDRAAAVARAASSGASSASVAAMRTFCRVLGAEAGNLALKALTRGGVFLAGGIAPKIVEWLEGGDFLEGFTGKGRYRDLLRSIPVIVVLDPVLGLRGAARAAQSGERMRNRDVGS
jgi:glucokinase